jgi:ketosteroid isomerase-like protein
MGSDARSVGEGYFDAWTSGDFETARSMVHDDLTFRGPFETFERADDFFESLRRVGGGLLERAEKRKVFVDGGDVCVIYDFVAKPPVGPSPTVEWYRVRDGKIAEIQIVFDTRPFAALQQ